MKRLLFGFAVVALGSGSFIPPNALAQSKQSAAKDPHYSLFAEESYPSATKCARCHVQIYNEWASSNHAYASISPMFHKFEQSITNLTQGTIGSFCVRCHQQVGTQRGEKRWLPLWERSDVAREGVTCITCHRVNEYYGKVNGERSIQPGPIYAPVYGTKQDSVFDATLAKKGQLRIATSPKERGTPIHAKVIKFDTLSKSEFCMSCHQVAVNLGIKLEVVWEQYRDSPAFRKGVTCQDCHMGKVPGVAAGFDTAPSAVVNGVPINPNRPHHNHAFYGPGYPVAHPGIFPQNPKAARWDIEDWLKFDFRAKWGSREFERRVEKVANAFADFDLTLAPLGGHIAAISALDAFDTAVSRGTLGFTTKRARTRLLKRLEPLKGAVSPQKGREAVSRIPRALAALAAVVRATRSGMEPKLNALSSAARRLSGRVPLAGGFDSALAGLDKAVETLPAKVTDADVARIKGLSVKLRSAMPGAEPGFQKALADLKDAFSVNFPAVWADGGDREDAWQVIRENLAGLEAKRDLRRQVMENGSHIDGPFFEGDRKAGESLSFRYVIRNIDEGHNLPSGSLGAQPEIWLNVALTDPDGKNVWESGYTDSNGDFADIHSLDLAKGKIAYDDQLVNLQTKFLTTNVKGTDREMYLPVNFDLDQRPFLRPANVPASILNHPPFVRMEQRSVPPLGTRTAEYTVPASVMKKPGKYKLSVRLRSRAEPLYFMKFVGATNDMIRGMNQWIVDIHPYTVEFDVK